MQLYRALMAELLLQRNINTFIEHIKIANKKIQLPLLNYKPDNKQLINQLIVTLLFERMRVEMPKFYPA
jgi:hypothetical protein